MFEAPKPSRKEIIQGTSKSHCWITERQGRSRPESKLQRKVDVQTFVLGDLGTNLLASRPPSRHQSNSTANTTSCKQRPACESLHQEKPHNPQHTPLNFITSTHKVWASRDPCRPWISVNKTRLWPKAESNFQLGITPRSFAAIRRVLCASCCVWQDPNPASGTIWSTTSNTKKLSCSSPKQYILDIPLVELLG